MRKAILLAAFFCAACSNYSANLPSIKPYKMDIQQGNVVTSKMMMQLRPGMTKSQVRFIMGTPLIADSFHANRWDYIYRMQKDGKLVEQRHVILDFENDQLKRVRGDVIPAGSGEAVSAEAAAKPAGTKPAAAPAKKEKGLIDKLKFWKGDEAEAPAKLESEPELVNQPKPAPAKVLQPKPAPAPRPGQATQPESEPKAAPESAVVPEPEAEQKQPAASAAKPVEQPKVETVSEPAKQPEAEARPAPKPVEPQSAAVQPAKAEPKAAPIPADELPPEDDPGYFERMLEKIGF